MNEDINSSYTRLHQGLIRHLWLKHELLLNYDGRRAISEYDIQYFGYDYLNSVGPKYGFMAERETYDRTDLVIKHKDSDHPVAFIEIKTYLKGHESLNNRHFETDFSKLFRKLGQIENQRAYFVLLAGYEKLDTEKAQSHEFINNVLRDSRVNSDLSHCNYEIEGHTIRLRPSASQQDGRTKVLSWEILAP
jgi:hypothetical protein